MFKKRPRRQILIHLKHGRESTACGRGLYSPAFMSVDINAVTCPRCLKVEIRALNKLDPTQKEPR